ncbi:polyhomeotic-like protein 3 [Myripristis murdjan]|uniref:polyhomeotic-like protein 3 n=1 Tax=Myripristis murdjan TaxID=586833 RepID=UPI001175EF9F|nr:polyhomeotic-like protein 3 [Myripristis murdjan]
MDRQSPGEKEAQTNRAVAATTPTTSAVITMATVSSGNPTCTQALSTTLSIVPPDRQAVQVIQQAIHRPQTMAAQYLHQMYAAQQQHLMLQTAALQQHQHTPHLQSLATIQQASILGRRQSPSLPSSSNGSLPQPAGASQNSITLPASPVAAQLIGRTQTSSSTAAGSTISQQAMLLGNRPANCNQAQMYLRTQMVQNLAVRAHLPAALTTAQSVFLKPSSQSQAMAPATALSKMSICALKANQHPDTTTETGSEAGQADVTHLTPGPQIIAPVQPHALVKQQLPGPPSQHGAQHSHQLILQQATGGASSHRQLQPIALRVAPQETNCTPLPLSIKRLATPTSAITQSQASNDSPALSSSCITCMSASSAQTSAPAATTQPQPPPLVAAPQRRTSFPQVQNQPPPPPPPLVLPRLPQNPPASLQRQSLLSVQALAAQSGQVLLTEEELPVAEALVQMPYQSLPPPQTVAVDLKVHPVRHTEAPALTQTCKINGLSSGERKEEHLPSPQRDRSPSPAKMSSRENGTAATGLSRIPSGHSVVQSSEVEKPSHSTSSSDPPPPPSPLPPPILPDVVGGLGQPPLAPTSLPGSPDSLFRPHILTHLIEGFVIREGLEPFPVGPSSLLADQQATLPESQEIQANGDAAPEDSPLEAEQSDSTDSEMENDAPAADEPKECVADVLQCEFCGKMGHVHTFLRSRRFCSMTCVRRFSVSCTKRVTLLKAGRWGHRPMGRRGRPPGRVNGASREHFLRQAHRSFCSEETQQAPLREVEEEEEEEEEEDAPPVPMTTRLRRQAESGRAQQKEREQEQRMTETASGSDGEEDLCSPCQWNVEQVCSYINSLPGGRDIAEQFRSQEIDGQALLLLTEDHLVSTMNLKLGPALKLCAHFNSLKDSQAI